MEDLSEGHRQQDEEDRSRRGGRILGEGSGHNGGEDGNYQDQCGQREDQEEGLAADADILLDDLPDGVAPVPDARDKARHVVRSAEKDRSDQHPEKDRDPTEDSRCDRTDDRCRSCD